jgi:inner membrane protein
MTGKTHQIIGIAAGLTYYLAAKEPAYNPATFGSVLVGSHLAALIPDLDRPAAKIWDFLPYGHTVGKVVDPLIKHRNISHSLIGMAIFAALIHFLFASFPSYWGIETKTLFWAGIIAYGSHLLADSVTDEGIPLLFPSKRMFGLPPKPFEGARIVTGKWFENLVLFPSFNLYLIVLAGSNWGFIRAVLLK